MKEYRQMLDAAREKLLSRGTNHSDLRQSLEKRVKKRKKKKKRRKRSKSHK